MKDLVELATDCLRAAVAEPSARRQRAYRQIAAIAIEANAEEMAERLGRGSAMAAEFNALIAATYGAAGHA